MVSEILPAAPCSLVRFVGSAGAEKLSVYTEGKLLIPCF